ncbi:MAG: energy transducer TonB [Spirochaetes bacterium]|nr:energy transducer TonB [Spirochaetota bacterium]
MKTKRIFYISLICSVLVHAVFLLIPGLFKAGSIKHDPAQEAEYVEVILTPVNQVSDRTRLEDESDVGQQSAEKNSIIAFREVLRAEIYKNLEYPFMARKRKLEGKALINFTVACDGRLLNFRIKKSSGFEILDREVKKALEKITCFPSFPEPIKKDKLNFDLMINFILKEANLF